MMKTLFLQPPSFGGFDGGAGSRYQAKREIRSFWYPTWLAQPAALVPGSKLIDAPPANLGLEPVLDEVRRRDLVIMHTSTPSFASDAKVAAALKEANPALKIGFVGAKVAVQPGESLQEGPAIDFVARNEFDFTCLEVAEGRDLASIDGITIRDLGRAPGAIVSFTMEGYEADTIVSSAAAAGISIGASHPSSTRIDAEVRGLPVVVRASPHYYNTEAEIDRLIAHVAGLALP